MSRGWDRNTKGSVSELIRNIRTTRLLLIQPRSRDSKNLYKHLERIGCRITSSWPPPKNITSDIDVVMVALRPIVETEVAFNWDVKNPPAALVVVLDYENPVSIEASLRLNADAVIGLPFRNFGILSSLIIAQRSYNRHQQAREHNNKLEQRIKNLNTLVKAKEIIMTKRSVNEAEAYRIIRKHAMQKHTTIQNVAEAIIHANEVI